METEISKIITINIPDLQFSFKTTSDSKKTLFQLIESNILDNFDFDGPFLKFTAVNAEQEFMDNVNILPSEYKYDLITILIDHEKFKPKKSVVPPRPLATTVTSAKLSEAASGAPVTRAKLSEAASGAPVTRAKLSDATYSIASPDTTADQIVDIHALLTGGITFSYKEVVIPMHSSRMNVYGEDLQKLLEDHIKNWISGQIGRDINKSDFKLVIRKITSEGFGLREIIGTRNPLDVFVKITNETVSEQYYNTLTFPAITPKTFPTTVYLKRHSIDKIIKIDNVASVVDLISKACASIEFKKLCGFSDRELEYYRDFYFEDTYNLKNHKIFLETKLIVNETIYVFPILNSTEKSTQITNEINEKKRMLEQCNSYVSKLSKQLEQKISECETIQAEINILDRTFTSLSGGNLYLDGTRLAGGFNKSKKHSKSKSKRHSKSKKHSKSKRHSKRKSKRHSKNKY
jgi:hypothetical protein